MDTQKWALHVKETYAIILALDERKYQQPRFSESLSSFAYQVCQKYGLFQKPAKTKQSSVLQDNTILSEVSTDSVTLKDFFSQRVESSQSKSRIEISKSVKANDTQGWPRQEIKRQSTRLKQGFLQDSILEEEELATKEQQQVNRSITQSMIKTKFTHLSPKNRSQIKLQTTPKLMACPQRPTTQFQQKRLTPIEVAQNSNISIQPVTTKVRRMIPFEQSTPTLNIKQSSLKISNSPSTSEDVMANLMQRFSATGTSRRKFVDVKNFRGLLSKRDKSNHAFNQQL
ncbi:hypothetical protein FGO68_gene11025 [Halteria grandinella]|uniref:Uncharacterized protein n=1 Tax=Halteria grandinella TaxID=5974 RepID=A0A8J8NMF9_HALGN|nr:hypothetical protein FGO68_gene11025 [Halteria grandinella]